MAGVRYGDHFAVESRIIILYYLIMSYSDHLAILYNHSPKWTAIAGLDSFKCLVYGHLHKFIICFYHITLK